MYNKIKPLSRFIVAASCLLMTACNNDSASSDNTDIDGSAGTTTDAVILTNSDVDFSNCREIAGGITVAKASLQEQVPTDVCLLYTSPSPRD